MAPKTVGMDFTEVNFELASSAQERINDEQTFRHLLELICHSINVTDTYDKNIHVPTFMEPHSYQFEHSALKDNLLRHSG
jgi:hypothetical protein